MTTALELPGYVAGTWDIDPVHSEVGFVVGHLGSADFFEVETYPTMTYKASGVRQDGDKFVLDGELTLKGVTKVVPLTFEVNGIAQNPMTGGTVAGFSGTATINRKEFNVNFEGVQNGIAVVSDKVDIHVEVE